MVRAVIIEGNLSFRQSLEDIIHYRFPSIELTVVPSGKIAMEKIETAPPDLGLIDMKLPAEDGLELARKVKSRHPNVILIMISSYDLPEYREAAYRHGVEYFISENAPIEDYCSLIRSILTDRCLGTKEAKREDGVK